MSYPQGHTSAACDCIAHKCDSVAHAAEQTQPVSLHYTVHALADSDPLSVFALLIPCAAGFVNPWLPCSG